MKGETKVKLYSVTTIVKRFSGRDNIPFYWFVPDRFGEPSRPYAELIADYDPQNEYRTHAEDAIDELFTADEAEQLVSYLNRQHGDAGTTEINEVMLPIAGNVANYGAFPTGAGIDFYMLHREPEYSLPFKVSGYFDLGDRTIDERIWRVVARLQATLDNRVSEERAAWLHKHPGASAPAWLREIR
jgi:hypothetical protein